LVVDEDVVFFQFVDQIDIVDTENQKRIIVDFPAQHVNHRSQVFARHHPVGTRALHLEIRPLAGEYLQPSASTMGRMARSSSRFSSLEIMAGV
jgi:hypothetical protein